MGDAFLWGTVAGASLVVGGAVALRCRSPGGSSGWFAFSAPKEHE